MTVNVAPAAPAVALDGDRVLIVGIGSVAEEIVKGNVFERSPKLLTSIFTVPAETTSEAGMTAVSCVALTNVVAKGKTVGVTDGGAGGITQLIPEPFTKFEPVTVRITPEAPHEVVEAEESGGAERLVIVGATIVIGSPEVVPPPGPCVRIFT